MALAAGLACLALLLLLAVPARLARARWPRSAPTYAVLLWQALGLTGGLLALELLATVALQPYGPSHSAALAGLVRQPELPPWWSLVAGVLFLLLLGRLLSVLLRSTARTLAARRAHRRLVDVVATRNPLLPRALVLDHDLPVVYCLPGLRSRVVLSRGVLQTLRDDELRAVLAHEAAHLEQRHDLVVLPFVALRATFPRLGAVQTASAQIGLLVEMLADDRAARRCSREVLSRALAAVGAGTSPEGGLAAAGPDELGITARLRRLDAPPAALRPGARVAAAAAVLATLTLPLWVLLAPLA